MVSDLKLKAFRGSKCGSWGMGAKGRRCGRWFVLPVSRMQLSREGKPGLHTKRKMVRIHIVNTYLH